MQVVAEENSHPFVLHHADKDAIFHLRWFDGCSRVYALRHGRYQAAARHSWGFAEMIFPRSVKSEVRMTKAELVEKVTALGDLTRRDGEVIVDAMFEAVIGALRAGDKIEIRGFGSFRTRQRKPRIGRNPKTGARVDVPAKRVPFFKPSKELRDMMNPPSQATT